jgi:PhzF family phenazine biosynthesis protein
MTALQFKKIDAFTSGRAPGNPAGAVYLERPEELSASEMQRVAAECKGWVSEVGFVAKLAHGRYWLRYYSSQKEVDFCGHATVAISYDLISSTPDLMAEKALRLCTKNNELDAFNHMQAEDAVFISAPPAIYRKREIGREECARALNTSAADVDPKATINAGLDTLIVEMKSLKAVLSLSPGFDELRTFCELHQLDTVLVYTNEVSTKAAYRTRVFPPRFGYLEDPATGSGNAAFGYYLLKAGAWKEGRLAIEQNGSYENPNEIKLILDTRHTGVLFGGSARVKVRGEYIL